MEIFKQAVWRSAEPLDIMYTTVFAKSGPKDNDRVNKAVGEFYAMLLPVQAKNPFGM